MVRTTVLVMLAVVACGKPKKDPFELEVKLGDHVGVVLDGLQVSVAGQTARVDHGHATFMLPASTPPLAGQSGDLVVADTPCGDLHVKFPLGITPDDEKGGRVGVSRCASADMCPDVDLFAAKLAPKRTTFYFDTHGKPVTIGKRTFDSPPKSVDIFAADCAPLAIKIGDVTITTPPKDAPAMDDPYKEARGDLDNERAFLVTDDPAACYDVGTVTYGSGPADEHHHFTGANLYRLPLSGFSFALEILPASKRTSGGGDVSTVLLTADCP
jgi:hypothetical protein